MALVVAHGAPAEAMPYRKLLETISRFLEDPEDLSGAQELSDGIAEHRADLLSPDPTKLPARSASDRQTLGGLQLQLHGQEVTLDMEQAQAIVQLSDHLDCNELLCAEVWVAVRDFPAVRAELEAAWTLPADSLQDNLFLAAQYHMYRERSFLLAALCELLKGRLMDEVLSDEKLSIIKGEVNALLRDGLALNLMALLSRLLKAQTRMHAATAAAAAPALPDPRAQFASECTAKAAECLFYTYYGTHIVPREALELAALLETTSATARAVHREQVEAELGGGGAAAHGAFHGVANGRGGHFGAHAGRAAATMPPVDADRASALAHVATVVLLALVSALDTTTVRDDRVSGAAMRGTQILGGGGGGGADAQQQQQAAPAEGATMSATELAELHNRLIEKRWENAAAQGAAALAWAVGLAPGADGGGENEVQNVQAALQVAQNQRGYSHLAGPVTAALLTAQRSGDASSNQYFETLAMLAQAFLEANWLDARGGAWALLPATRAEDSEALHAAAAAGAYGARQASRRSRPDCLEDVLHFIAAVSETWPQFVRQCFSAGSGGDGGGDAGAAAAEAEAAESLGCQVMAAVDARAHAQRTLQAPLLRLAAAFAAAAPAAVHKFFSQPHTQFGWHHFLGNLDQALRGLEGSGAAALAAAAAADAGAPLPPPQPPRPLSPRAAEVFFAFAQLLQRCLAAGAVRTEFMRSVPELPAMLLRLAMCPVALPLRGAAFAALAVVSGGGGGGEQAAAAGATAAWAWRGLAERGVFASQGGAREQLDVEARERTYPATDGLLTLLQALCAAEAPPPDAAAPAVAFVVGDVLLRAGGLAYALAGERWRLVARALHAVLALLRRYPVHALAAHAGARRPPAAPTTADVAACRADFDPKAAAAAAAPAAAPQRHASSLVQFSTAASGAQVAAAAAPAPRAKSPGYTLLQELLRGGPLLDVLVGVLTEAGGAAGAVALRRRLGREGVAEALRAEDAGERALAFGDADATALGDERRYRADWAWWRERCAVLGLSILQAAMEREADFRDRCKAAVLSRHLGTRSLHARAAPFSDDYAGAPLSSVAALLASDTAREPIAAVADCCALSGGAAAAPLLALDVLLRLVRELRPEQALAAVAGASAMGSGGGGGGRARRAAQLGAVLSQRLSGEWVLQLSTAEGYANDATDILAVRADDELLGADAVLLRVGGSGGGRAAADAATDAADADEALEAVYVRAARCGLLDLLLEGARSGKPNLSLALLGLADTVAADGKANRGQACAAARAGAVGGALAAATRTPDFLFVDSDVAERVQHLLYALCANRATYSTMSTVLGDYHRRQLAAAAAAVAAATGAADAPPPLLSSPAAAHAVAWLLQGAAVMVNAGSATRATERLVSCLLAPPTAALLDLLQVLPLARPAPRTPLPAAVRDAPRDAIVPLPGPPDVATGYQIVDVTALRSLLQTSLARSAGGAGGGDGDAEARSLVERAMRWAVEYNTYVARLCARAHLAGAWRDAAECAALAALDAPRLAPGFAPLLAAALAALRAHADAEAQLLEPIGRVAAVVMATLQFLAQGGNGSGGGGGLLVSAAEGRPLLAAMLDLAAAPLGGTDAWAAKCQADLRAHVYTCTLHYLSLTAAAAAAAALQRGDGDVDVDAAAEHHVQNVEMLSAAVLSAGLVAALVRDAADAGAQTRRRASAMCLLTAILTTLTAPAALDPEVAARGAKDAAHLALMLYHQGLLEAAVLAAVAAGSASAAGDEELRSTALALLTAVAATAPGAEALLEMLALKRLAGTADGDGGRSVDGSDVSAAALLPLLRLAQAMAATLPLNRRVANQVAAMLKGNANVAGAHRHLALREPTLAGLRTAAAVAALLAHISRPDFVAETQTIVLAEGQRLVRRAAQLLLALGAAPLPPAALRRRSGGAADGVTVWEVVDAQEGTREEAAAVTEARPPPGVSSSVGWTQFQTWLLQESQAALARLAQLMRLQAQANPQQCADALPAREFAATLSACHQLYTMARTGKATHSYGHVPSYEASELNGGGGGGGDSYAQLRHSAEEILTALLAGVMELAARRVLRADACAALAAPLQELARERDAFISRVARHTLEDLPRPASGPWSPWSTTPAAATCG